MMIGKQLITDILVVVVLPLLLIGGYYYLRAGENLLLSSDSRGIAASGAKQEALGEKTTLALAMLESTKLDVSIFNDPAYLSLRDFSVTISTTTLGRPYPFTSPPQIRELLQRAATGRSSGEVISPAERLDVLSR